MTEITVFSNKGQIKKITASFSKKASNLAALAQALRVYFDRKHPHLGRVKTRGEVNKSTRKIYRQKGTGGARHGAKSAPIFVGGGIAHGPTRVSRRLYLPKSIKRTALETALSTKLQAGRVAGIEDIDSFKKTSDAQRIIDAIRKALKVDHAARIALIVGRDTSAIAFRNIKNVEILRENELNAYTATKFELLLFDSGLVGKQDKKQKPNTLAEKNPKIAKKDVSTRVEKSKKVIKK
jgi:large subunit ribosomal protein L4